MLIRIAPPSPLPGSPAAVPDVTALRSRRWLWVLIGLVLLLLLVWGLIRWNSHRTPPATLAQAVLTGPRGPECLRLVVAEDVSGSMADYALARAQALTAVLAWAPGQLRADDELAVITFAASATTRLQPTPVGQTAVPADTAADGGDTLFTPVVDAAAQFPTTSCHTHLLVVGDGLIFDGVEAGDLTRLSASGIDSVGLLMPSTDLDAPEEFLSAFPYAQTDSFDGTDADETALALAQVVATQTGQSIERR